MLKCHVFVLNLYLQLMTWRRSILRTGLRISRLAKSPLSSLSLARITSFRVSITGNPCMLHAYVPYVVLIGVSHERLNVLHRASARACLVLLWIHALVRGLSGYVILLAYVCFLS